MRIHVGCLCLVMQIMQLKSIPLRDCAIIGGTDLPLIGRFSFSQVNETGFKPASSYFR